MYQAQQALIQHLNNATSAASSAVSSADQAQTIKEYAGEVQQAASKGAIGLKWPAILVLFSSGNPMSRLPELEFELIMWGTNQNLDREQAKENALKFAQSYAQYLRDNQAFEDRDSYYTLSGQGTQNLEDQQIETILNDFKYCILGLPVTVQVDRQS